MCLCLEPQIIGDQDQLQWSPGQFDSALMEQPWKCGLRNPGDWLTTAFHGKLEEYDELKHPEHLNGTVLMILLIIGFMLWNLEK